MSTFVSTATTLAFFGFFDTLEDQEVATALVNRAASWLADRGMSLMRGPCSLSINDEAGILIEGFDEPAVIMSAHHRAYQGVLAEGAGLRKVRDCYSWWYDIAAPTRARAAGLGHDCGPSRSSFPDGRP